MAPGQGYFRNNRTGQITTFDGPPPKVSGAAPALPAPQAQTVEPGRQRVVLPRLNPNLTTGAAIADFIGQAATAGETIAANRARAGAEKRGREAAKDDREAFAGDLAALKAVKDLRAPPTLEQVKASRAQTLLDENPADFSATDRLLFGDRSSQTRRIIGDPVTGEDGYPTGAKRFYSVDPATGQAVPVELPGAGQRGQGTGVPEDGIYEVPGRGRLTVKGGRVYDATGKEVKDPK
ncbi:MAG: hypothetical protein ACREXW_00915 [Gammaproteobacteria bacterium]